LLPIPGEGYIDRVMATRKRTTQKPPSGTASGRVAILLEQIQEQNRATIEAVTSLGTSLRREISELRRDLTLRIEALEIAVRKNSEDIRKNSEDIRKLQEQVAELTEVVRGKVDRADLEALALRVARLEARLGI
jgi:chromosome segregation ATPase